jgi:hypothetical protein
MPKFFYCDDVPRQTMSSVMLGLVSATESFLTTSPSSCKPETVLSGGDPDFYKRACLGFAGYDLQGNARNAISMAIDRLVARLARRAQTKGAICQGILPACPKQIQAAESTEGSRSELKSTQR